jgi:hypothetical protein
MDQFGAWGIGAAWVEADSNQREVITAATAKIDQVLRSSPGEFGESRSGDWRIAFVPPLGMAFAVDEAQRAARLAHLDGAMRP